MAFLPLKRLLKVLLAAFIPQACFVLDSGWLGGAMVLGKLPVPGRPTNLDLSKVRANRACSGWGLFGHFFSFIISLFFLPLSGRRPDID